LINVQLFSMIAAGVDTTSLAAGARFPVEGAFGPLQLAPKTKIREATLILVTSENRNRHLLICFLRPPTSRAGKSHLLLGNGAQALDNLDSKGENGQTILARRAPHG
jgi:hypothetical protein